MAIEIERKFLLAGDDWKKQAKGIRYRQGYLLRKPGCVVRIRVAGERGFITVKASEDGLARQEFEYAIPVSDAETMLECLCHKPIIDKHRYRVPHEGFTWEIDEFHGENEGLVVAEIELESENQPFEKPEWLGQEVTSDPRYYNANLVREPFSSWDT